MSEQPSGQQPASNDRDLTDEEYEELYAHALREIAAARITAGIAEVRATLARRSHALQDITRTLAENGTGVGTGVGGHLAAGTEPTRGRGRTPIARLLQEDEDYRVEGQAVAADRSIHHPVGVDADGRIDHRTSTGSFVNMDMIFRILMEVRALSNSGMLGGNDGNRGTGIHVHFNGLNGENFDGMTTGRQHFEGGWTETTVRHHIRRQRVRRRIPPNYFDGDEPFFAVPDEWQTRDDDDANRSATRIALQALWNAAISQRQQLQTRLNNEVHSRLDRHLSVSSGLELWLTWYTMAASERSEWAAHHLRYLTGTDDPLTGLLREAEIPELRPTELSWGPYDDVQIGCLVDPFTGEPCSEWFDVREVESKMRYARWQAQRASRRIAVADSVHWRRRRIVARNVDEDDSADDDGPRTGVPMQPPPSTESDVDSASESEGEGERESGPRFPYGSAGNRNRLHQVEEDDEDLGLVSEYEDDEDDDEDDNNADEDADEESEDGDDDAGDNDDNGDEGTGEPAGENVQSVTLNVEDGRSA